MSGKDSLCTLLVQKEREPDLPYEYVFWDVGMELPETYAWLDDVEKKLGIKVHRGKHSLWDAIAEVGHLPSPMRRFCTKLTKIKAYREFINSDPDTDLMINYVGFRYDERERIPTGGVDRLTTDDGVQIKEVYPLVEAQVGVADVYRVISDKGLYVPNFFWQRLWDRVYERCGTTSREFMDTLPPWTKAYLFNWRSRSNCFCCFYQRLYEWVGLLEHHPAVFDQAVELERVYGGHRSEYRVEKHEDYRMKRDFNFHQGWPLTHIKQEAARLFEKRVNEVYKEVTEGKQKPRIELDMLSATSCGAYCGK